jgi:hypothetical protein
MLGLCMRAPFRVSRSRAMRRMTGMRARHGLTAQQYIRVLAAYLLFSVVLCCLGLWLRAPDRPAERR